LQRQLEDESLATWLGNVTSDNHERHTRIVAIESATQVYSADELSMFQVGMDMFERFEESQAKSKELRLVSTVDELVAKLDEHSSILLGRVRALIGTTPLHIVAYMLSYDSRHINSQMDSGVSARVVQMVNDHHTVTFNRVIFGFGWTPRTFLNSVVAKKLANEPPTYGLVVVPILNHDQITNEDDAGAIRAENFRSFKLTEIETGVTELEYVCSLDLKCEVSEWASNPTALPQQLLVASSIQRYFQHIRPLNKCTAEDGNVVANMLMDVVSKTKKKGLPSAIRMFARRTVMLRESGFSHLGTMLASYITGDDDLGVADDVEIISRDPGLVTEKEAIAMGCSLSADLAELRSAKRSSVTALWGGWKRIGSVRHSLRNLNVVTATVTVSVVEVLSNDKYASLQQMSQTHGWFLPMLEAIATRLHADETKSVRASSRRSTAFGRVSSRVSPAVEPNSERGSRPSNYFSLVTHATHAFSIRFHDFAGPPDTDHLHWPLQVPVHAEGDVE
jgi:hypothetical protein